MVDDPLGVSQAQLIEVHLFRPSPGRLRALGDRGLRAFHQKGFSMRCTKTARVMHQVRFGIYKLRY